MSLNPRNLYGLGFSPLSIENKRHAFDEEMVADKRVGLFGIHHSDGESDTSYIVSAEYLGRCKEHLTETINRNLTDNTIGKIYKLTLDDDLIHTVTKTGNVFSNSVSINNGNEPFSVLRFNIDFDLFRNENLIQLLGDDIDISIEFTLKKGTSSKTFTISEKLVDLNSKAYALGYDFVPPGTEGEYEISIDSMTFTMPDGYDNTAYNMVVYEILMTLV